MKKIILAVVLVLAARTLFTAENRYALVIGNGNYRDRSIASLANPVNDATDLAASLGSLGYNVTLKTNAGLIDMINAIKDFSVDLMRDPANEGFFWFAGHGLSVRNIHYMLPVDVNPVDDNLIARGSYSVDDLMEEIENARNRTNLIVIDACRNTLLPGGSRSVGTRGLAVLSQNDYRIRGNKIVYSTMAGRTASDGLPGSRNSPFAQAFISLIDSQESFDDVFLDIANETLRLTKGEQEPYSMGAFAVKSYSLNPRPAATAAVTTAVVQAEPLPPAKEPAAPRPPREKKQREALDLAYRNTWSLGALVGSTFYTPALTASLTAILPFVVPYTFFGIGLDAGFIDTVSSSEQYNSFYPYLHYNAYLPLAESKIAPYIGLGAGFMMSTYTFPKDTVTSNLMAFDAAAGIKLLGFIDLNYSLRVSSKGAGSRLAAGVFYSFGQ